MNTLAEVSQLTGIPHATLRTRINRGKLKATKKGKTWFISDYILNKLKEERNKKVGVWNKISKS